MTLQTVGVLVVVVAAASYLASRYLRMFGRKGGCGGCGCSKTKSSQENPMSVPVPLQELSLRRKST
jgi:FeoB-associated Cys-rich membrane protein